MQGGMVRSMRGLTVSPAPLSLSPCHTHPLSTTQHAKHSTAYHDTAEGGTVQCSAANSSADVMAHFEAAQHNAAEQQEPGVWT